LDSRYGIQQLNGLDDDNMLESGHDVWATWTSSGSRYRTIPLHIANFYKENKINEIQDFLLVLISTQPLDVSPLTQPDLKPIREVSRAVSIEESKHSFVLPEGDWTVRKIPIRIVYDDRDFEQIVKDTVASKPIQVPGDLHKNRWGKKTINNGFILSAEVTEKTLGLFRVQLKVRHQEALLNTGEVAFLLHDSFNTPIRIENFINGVATIELTAYEDFTAAAIMFDGTELELDLSEIPGLPEKFYALHPRDKFKQQVESLVQKTTIVFPADPQKGRWGGQASRNGYTLSATVTQNLLPGAFDVVLEINTTERGATGQVAFLLHDSFAQPIRIRSFEDNKATVAVTAREDFTAAAILEDGTQLELDLSEMTGLPEGFYANVITHDFEKEVTALVKAKTISVPNDLQKNRWGGQAANNSKQLTATVTPKNDSHEVTLTIQSLTGPPLNGEVAFFLHDSFDKEIVYGKAIDGKATCVLNSYEAFTVGAYTADGTTLELDLNQVTGFPEEFYYK
ncbi:MAG TPA: pYEATS domain-containing protein, partial [Niastella sp.]